MPKQGLEDWPVTDLIGIAMFVVGTGVVPDGSTTGSWGRYC